MIKSSVDIGYQQCAQSLMDNIADPFIYFDENGVSNYYYQYVEHAQQQNRINENIKKSFNDIINQIEAQGKANQYNCIIGVSGGFDSSLLAYKAKDIGLRPLLVHFDNGWNAVESILNINNLTEKLQLDLYSVVVDWKEFKDLQFSYFKSGVVDIEAITDHAIIASLYQVALKFGIKYILSGSNALTEFTLPNYWIWNKYDHINILDIHKRFGTIELSTYPLYDRILKKRVQFNGIKRIDLLNLLNVNPSEDKLFLKEKLNWIDFSGKHHESVFTRFYQGYILPQKFNIDKRKAHLSNLIFSGQLTKHKAIDMLACPTYDPDQLKLDKSFVLTKLELTEDWFDEWIKKDRVEHDVYRIEKSFWDSNFILKRMKFLRNLIH